MIIDIIIIINYMWLYTARNNNKILQPDEIWEVFTRFIVIVNVTDWFVRGCGVVT